MNPGNLPRLRTDTVGDLAELQQQTDSSSSRTLTLTGSGGVRTTRAALEIGWRSVDEFVDGVWFIDLAAVADDNAVPGATAAVLGVVNRGGVASDESIVEWCSDRRMPLGVPGEQVVRSQSLRRGDAIELFLLRAVAADSSFDASSADHDVTAAVCDRVDGIPLAIELDAARIASSTAREILDDLDDRLRRLRSSGRGGLERHQTLRATTTWSYRLLPDVERNLFDRMSAFAGVFDLRATEAIGAGDDIGRDDVVAFVLDRLGATT